MRPRVAIVTCFLFVIPFSGKTQAIDSLSNYLKQKPKFVFGFDARRSFIFSNNAKIGGIKMGLEYGKKIRFGLGIYALTSPFYRQVITENDLNQKDTLHPRFGLSYWSPYLEYVVYQDKRWEFSVPFQFGFGNISLDDTLTNESIKRQSISLMELSFVGHYKFFPWIGIGSGIGYRQMLTSNEIVEESLSSPIYILKLKLFVGVIYRAVFPGKEKEDG